MNYKWKLTCSSCVLLVQGVSAIRLFPRSAHLLLSSSMDCKIKVGEFINLYSVFFAFLSLIISIIIFFFLHLLNANLFIICFCRCSVSMLFFVLKSFFFSPLQLWEVYKERRCIRTFIGKQSFKNKQKQLLRCQCEAAFTPGVVEKQSFPL